MHQMEEAVSRVIRGVGQNIYETWEILTVERASHEIAGYMRRFIDWLAKEVTLKLVWHDDEGYTKEWHYLPDKWNQRGTTRKCWSIDELFGYWFDNIRESNK